MGGLFYLVLALQVLEGVALRGDNFNLSLWQIVNDVNDEGCRYCDLDYMVTDCPVDVLFVLDMSDSVSLVDYASARDYTARHIDAVTKAFQDTHVGVLAFSDGVYEEFPLQPRTQADLSQLRERVATLQQHRYGTQLADALQRAHTLLNTSSPSSLPWGQRGKVLVLLSDGCQDNDSRVKGVALELARDRVAVVTVQLSRPHTHLLRQISLQLVDLKKDIDWNSLLACPAELLPPINNLDCTDVVFAMDGSDSVRRWQKVQRHYLTHIALRYAAVDNAIGVVLFGTDVFNQSKDTTIEPTADKRVLAQRIQNSLVFPSGRGTGTSQAIARATADLRILQWRRQGPSRAGDRTIVVITDGPALNPSDARQAVSTAVQEGFQVVVVGVGDAVNASDLAFLVGGDSGKALHVDSYLSLFATDLSPFLCHTPRCANTSLPCSEAQTRNLDSCQCECPLTCQGIQIPDPDSCGCRCPVESRCSRFETWNPFTCLCESLCPVPQNCGVNLVWDQFTCQCVCTNPPQCPPPLSLDPSACTCGCPEVATCSNSQVWNPNFCRCECPLAAYCVDNLLWNPNTCQCECLLTCPSDQQVNTATCVCEDVWRTELLGRCVLDGRCQNDQPSLEDCEGRCLCQCDDTQFAGFYCDIHIRPSLCNNCTLFNGHYLAGVEGRCDMYVVCDGGVGGRPHIMDCPPGTIFKQDLVSGVAGCDYPQRAQGTCPTDPCRILPPFSRYANSRSCGRYWQCDAAGHTLSSQCCPRGQAFDRAQGQCAPDDNCPNDCDPGFRSCGVASAVGDEETPWCPWRMVASSPQSFYSPRAPGQLQTCAPNQYFNDTLCQCLANAEPACAPYYDYSFNGSTAGFHNVQIVNSSSFGVSSSVGCFEGNGQVVLYRFSASGYHMDFFEINLRLWPYLNPLEPGQEMVVMSNGHCDGNQTLGVSLDRERVAFRVESAGGDRGEVLLPLQTDQNGWIDVVFRYERTQGNSYQMTGSVNGQSSSRTLNGVIQHTSCALQIGHGKGFRNLTGCVDDFKVWICRPGGEVSTSDTPTTDNNDGPWYAASQRYNAATRNGERSSASQRYNEATSNGERSAVSQRYNEATRNGERSAASQRYNAATRNGERSAASQRYNEATSTNGNRGGRDNEAIPANSFGNPWIPVLQRYNAAANNNANDLFRAANQRYDTATSSIMPWSVRSQRYNTATTTTRPWSVWSQRYYAATTTTKPWRFWVQRFNAATNFLDSGSRNPVVANSRIQNSQTWGASRIAQNTQSWDTQIPVSLNNQDRGSQSSQTWNAAAWNSGSWNKGHGIAQNGYRRIPNASPVNPASGLLWGSGRNRGSQ